MYLWPETIPVACSWCGETWLSGDMISRWHGSFKQCFCPECNAKLDAEQEDEENADD